MKKIITLLFLMSFLCVGSIAQELVGNSFYLMEDKTTTGTGTIFKNGPTENYRFEVTFTGSITALTVRLNGGLSDDTLFPEETYTLDADDIAAGKAAFTGSNTYVNFVQAEIVTLTGTGTVTIKYSKF